MKGIHPQAGLPPEPGGGVERQPFPVMQDDGCKAGSAAVFLGVLLNADVALHKKEFAL
jgi:hypothetical protein